MQNDVAFTHKLSSKPRQNAIVAVTDSFSMGYLRRCIPTAISLCLIGLLAGCSTTSAPVSATSTTTSEGSSTTTYFPPPPPVITAKPKFAYTGNQGGSLSGYSVDISTGQLTPLSGFPMALGLNPTVVTHDPQNRFLIVGDIAASSLHVFAIDSTTGALAEVSPSPYATIKEPVGAVVDPTGTHVYVASQGSNQVGAYTLSASGTLIPVSGSPFSTGGTQDFGDSLVINTAGTFLYLQDTANIYVFSISASTGALTLQQTMAGPKQGSGIVLDPSGTPLYAVGSGTNFILTYSINATTGLLSVPSQSPLTENNGAYTIAISPNGHDIYTIENNNDLVSYAIDYGVFFPGGNVYPGVYGQTIAVDPSGNFVYVPQACSNCPSGVYNVVNQFSIGSTGALTQLSPAQVAAGVTPWGITVTSQ